MSATSDSMPSGAESPACKAIYCVLPDDGTDKRVMVELREKHGIVRASSATCRGIAALADAKTKHGKLPESELVKQLTVICTENQVDEIFDFIFWFAELDKLSRGVMWQQPVMGCTAYELPADIPDEEVGG